MKKIDELRQKKGKLQIEIRSLLDENKVDEAEKKMEEMRSLKKSMKMEEELDTEEREQVDEEFEKRSNKEKEDEEQRGKNENEEEYRSALAKYVQGKPLTGEERRKLETRQMNEDSSTGKGSDGGFLVPVTDDTSILTLRQAEDALETLITVIPVRTPQGKKTVRKRKSGGSNFAVVGEGKPIGKGNTPQYAKLPYECKKYASIYDITNELESDSPEDVIGEMNSWIGNDSRENRNALILAELAKATKVEMSGFDDIKKAYNVTLNTANGKYAEIITNQDGFQWMDTQKSSDGKYLLQEVVGQPGVYTFGGKKIHVYDNSILPSDITTEVGKTLIPMIVGDLKMSIIMFDLKKVTVKVTQEGGDAFDNDLTLMRAIEREDIQTFDAEAFVYGQLKITTP